MTSAWNVPPPGLPAPIPTVRRATRGSAPVTHPNAYEASSPCGPANSPNARRSMPEAPGAGASTSRPSSTRTSGRGGDPEARGRVLVGALEEPADHLLEVIERLGREQDRLIGRDVVVGARHLADVQRPDLHPAELLDLPVGGEDAGAVGAQLALLVHHAELHREPEYVGDRLDRRVALQPRDGRSRGLLQRRQARRAEHVPVADDLVDDVRLRRVERLRGMADVLRRMEHALAEGAIEAAQVDQARRRVVGDPGQRPQPLGHLAQLRDAILGQADGGLGLVELAHRVALVLDRELGGDQPPDLVLGRGVRPVPARPPPPPGERPRRDLVAAGAIHGVVEPGVTGAQVHDHSAVAGLRDRRVQLTLLEHAADTTAHVQVFVKALVRLHSLRTENPGSVVNMPEEIDQLDARLLLTLRANPRVGVLEVSRRLGVARGTVQARLDKLQRRGVITGFGPELDPMQMGYPVLAFVSLEIVQGRLEEAVAGLRRVPEVLEAHGVTGDRDLLCRVVAHDNGHLQDVINGMLQKGAVQRSISAISMTRQIPYRVEPLISAAVA